MRDYGKTIKVIRQSKNMSQEQLAKNIMSRSNLSRFEQGQYEPNYTKFIALLTRLAMTFDEFSYISNSFDISPSEKMYRQLVLAETTRDMTTIQSLSTKAHEAFQQGEVDYELIYYTAQFVLYQHTSTHTLQIEQIKNYVTPLLFDRENWFLQEFRLLNNFLALFDPDLIVYFTNRAIHEFEKYEHITIKNNVMVHLLLNAGTLLFDEEQLMPAKKFLLLAKKRGLTEEKFLPVILSECYLCLIDNQLAIQEEYSKELFDNRIALLTNWGYPQLSQNLKNKYSRF